MEAVTVVNAVLAIVLVVGGIIGISRGFVRQVVELAGLVGAFLLAVFFGGWLATFLNDRVGAPYSPALIVAFLALFIGGLLAFHLIAVGLQRLIHMSFLGWFDRILGGVLGVATGAFLASLLVTVVLELPVDPQAHTSVRESTVGRALAPVAPWVYDLVFRHGEGAGAYADVFRNNGSV